MTFDNSIPTPPPAPGDSGAPAAPVAAGADPATAPARKNVLGLLSLVLAAVGFVLAIVPFLGILGWPLLIAGLVLGIIGLTRKGQRKATSIAGLALSVLAMILAPIISLAIFVGSVNEAASTASDRSTSQSATADDSTATADAAAEDDEPEASTAAKDEPAVPVEYASALTKAESYVKIMHMSEQGVYDQLTSEYGEKFTPEAAQYAVDNVQADWNANALAKAKDYQKTMSMSPSAIHDQLTSQYGEKFTPAEADYAIAHLND